MIVVNILLALASVLLLVTISLRYMAEIESARADTANQIIRHQSVELVSQ